MIMSPEDIQELGIAKGFLENLSIAAKITNKIGIPIEKGFNLLPNDWREKIGNATRNTLMIALKSALYTMDFETKQASPLLHKIAAVASGSVGGAFGLPALLIELPISTTIILRSIADIGRAHGEELKTAEVRIACLEVFAFGGTSNIDDSSESGYFAVRGALARVVTEASEYLTEKTIVEESVPALIRLISVIAARFQVQVSEKAAAMAVPLIGAIGGGTINYLFMEHFQNISRGHFIVRKLERKYGNNLVRKTYEKL